MPKYQVAMPRQAQYHVRARQAINAHRLLILTRLRPANSPYWYIRHVCRAGVNVVESVDWTREPLREFTQGSPTGVVSAAHHGETAPPLPYHMAAAQLRPAPHVFAD